MGYSLYKNVKNAQYSRGYYKDINIPFDVTDDFITITPKYNQKPGLLANDLYGTPRLSWIFYYFNKDKMEDIIFDLKTGLTIRVPKKDRLLKYF